MALAQTTGGLIGTVVNAENNTPIANAKVTAVSPSQTSTTTSDTQGRFQFLSLAPDTYTVSAEKQGIESVSVSGVSVFAEQQSTTALRSRPQLRTIGQVTARGRSDLVQPGTTTDVYTVTPATQAAASSLGGGGALNSAYSGLASVPGVYIPQGQSGVYQSVYIRGGDYTQLGYEFDGVPIQRSFDQYPSTALSSLGQQNLQVYAGSGPIDAQSSGLAGFVNQVIKTGTYPGFVNANVSLGSPTYYKHGEIEVGGATANRNFSYYLATAGYNQEFRYLSQQNGAQYDAKYGTIYNDIASNCAGLSATIGCYTNGVGTLGALPAGPSGYALGPFSFGLQSGLSNRESVVNLHFGVPHKDGSKDDIQLLYDNSDLQTVFQTGQNDWNYANGNVANGSGVLNGVTYPTCGPDGYTGTSCAIQGPNQQAYKDNGSIFTGKVGVPLTAASLGQTQNYYFPNSSTNRLLGAFIPPAQRDTYDNRASIEKIQYTKTLGSHAFARIYGYSSYSDWLQNGANSTVINFAGGVSSDYELNAHTRGLALTLSDQLNSQNLLSLNGGYTYASTVRWNNSTFNSSPSVAYAVSSANPANGVCYGVVPKTAGTFGAVQCGAAAYRYVLPRLGSTAKGLYQPEGPLTPATGVGASDSLGYAGATSPSINAIGANNCGGAPCEYLVANNGVNGTYNTVAPRFTNFSIEDRFKPTDKILLSLGLHFDDFRYDLTDTSVPAGPQPNSATTLQRQFWTNSFINSNCQDAQTLLLVAKTSPSAKCPSGQVPVNFTTQSGASNDYHGFEPHLSATYTVDPLTVLRGSYSKILQAASSAFQQYNGAAGQLPLQAQFYPVGFRSPQHTVYPEESFNTDFSIEHQFKGSDTSFSVTPFYRVTNRQIFSVLLDPKTNFVSGINVGKSYIEGAEFQIKKGAFDRNGFAGQLSYTYTYGRVHYDNLPNGQTVLQPIQTGIQQYNAYTSACAGINASHKSDGRCNVNGTAISDPNTGSPIVAAPCYTAAGAPETACAAGDVANPYWNSPLQDPNQFSNGNFYTAFNQTIGANPGDSGSNVVSSFIIPHVAALLIQYKHGPFTITPTVQFSAGGKYGSPTTGYGVDPATCTANLASAGSAGVANDPRYLNGLPSAATPGNAYLAQTCSGALFTPNQTTGAFDRFGQYTEPSNLVGNVQISYAASKRVTFQAQLVNVVNQCFGGSKEPWTNAGSKVGCWYGTPPTAAYAGNFYNPGNSFQSTAAQPYGPTIGNVFQQAYGGQTNPFQAFFSMNVTL